jgi:hypothetical protein
VTAEGAERVIGAGDLASALADATEFTSFGASDHLSFTCADAATRASLVAALVDEAPESEFDDELWPDDSNVPSGDEFSAECVLRRRWIDIDGEAYHPLDLTDRTRLVRYNDDMGRIDGDELLFTASWWVDAAVTSSSGNDSLALVGGDVLLKEQRGDLFEVSIEIVDSVVLADRIAFWVADNLYGPATILHVVGAPGLEGADALENYDEFAGESGQGGHVNIWVAPDIRGPLVEALCRAYTPYAQFRDALLNPESPDGRALYTELAGVEAGDEDLASVLNRR